MNCRCTGFRWQWVLWYCDSWDWIWFISSLSHMFLLIWVFFEKKNPNPKTLEISVRVWGFFLFLWVFFFMFHLLWDSTLKETRGKKRTATILQPRTVYCIAWGRDAWRQCNWASPYNVIQVSCWHLQNCMFNEDFAVFRTLSLLD